jgi:hypothetical protein
MDREGFIHRSDDPDDRARLEEARRADAEGIAERLKRLEEADVDSERDLPDKAGGGVHPHNDRVLAANGFSLVREKAIATAATTPPIPALEAAIRYAKASRAQAAAQGAARPLLDGIDNELAQFDAVLKFARALRAIGERAEARARITGPDGNGAA